MSLYDWHAGAQPISTASPVAEPQRTRPLSVVMVEKSEDPRARAAERTVMAD